MVKITANNKQQFDLVREALTNHGFKFEMKRAKKYRWFGSDFFTIEVDYVPDVNLLRFLLAKAEEIEDYRNAAGIKAMLNKLS